MIARLFKRRGRPSNRALRIYYASDIHGAEPLWRKFLNAPRHYRADALVMGGDLTGKVVIPLVAGDDGTWEATIFGRVERAHGEDGARQIETRIRNAGTYPYRTTTRELEQVMRMAETEREAWFEEVMLDSFRGWIRLADERLAHSGVPCYVMPGNDDPPALSEIIAEGRYVLPCEDRIVSIGDYTMLSLGYSNRTPWSSPRELDEDQLYQRIAALAADVEDLSRCVFNLHVPPYDTGLDTAAQIDEDLRPVLAGAEPVMIPVGSTAVREVIEELQPLAAVHGHVHESAGATRIGRTLCINPGSDYHTGRIAGALLSLCDDMASHQFVAG